MTRRKTNHADQLAREFARASKKAMFLLKQEAGQFVGPDFYEFVPYNYGPFNSSIYDDLNTLAAAGLVTVNQSQGRSWAMYTITGAHFRGS
jgi:hypothetical protein